jgi:hypothetical protein
MPDDTHIDLQQTVAALRQELAATRAERDAELQRKTATRLTHPPPRWGRAGAGVTDRLAVGGMPRTDPW